MAILAPDETPVPDEQKSYGQKLVAQAGMLCKQKLFHDYLQHMQIIRSGVEVDESVASEALKWYLEINSRAELTDNEAAQQKLDELIGLFKNWKRNNYG